MPSTLSLALAWLVALLVARLAWVVVERERASHTKNPDNGLPYPDDGTTSIRVGAVVAVLLALGYAVTTTIDHYAGPLDADQMYELSRDAAFIFDDESASDSPTVDVDAVREAVRRAGGDPDDVVIHVVAPGWQRETSSESNGARFQLTNTAGEEPQCLEVTWLRLEEADAYQVDGTVSGEVC